MQLYMSRNEAKLLGVTQYFTGIKCKNGHLTYRYTSSGACAACIREHNRPVENSIMQVRKKIRDEFAQKRFRLYDGDYEIFAASVWSKGLEIISALTQSDIDPKLQPTDRQAGTGLYAFMCHPSHIEELQSVAASLRAARSTITPEVLERARAKWIALGGNPDSAD